MNIENTPGAQIEEGLLQDVGSPLYEAGTAEPAVASLNEEDAQEDMAETEDIRSDDEDRDAEETEEEEETEDNGDDDESGAEKEATDPA